MNPVRKPSILQIRSAFKHFDQILNIPAGEHNCSRPRLIDHESGRLRIRLSKGPDYLCLWVSRARPEHATPTLKSTGGRQDIPRIARQDIIPDVRWRCLHAAQINWRGHLANHHSDHPLELRELILLTALINLPTPSQRTKHGANLDDD
jgi:hypothetical protein